MKNQVLMSIIVIPLTTQGNWKLDSYKKVAPNKVSFSSTGMVIKINNSASPIIYSFEHPVAIKQFKITGEFKGLPSISNYSLQGKKGYDDYPLRIGFILDGTKKLSIFQKPFAPEWVKRLYANVPVGAGIDGVEFYNVTQSSSQLGTSRIHPASDLLHETFFAYLQESGKFSYDVKLNPLPKIAGIWISSDGDDTHSEYEVDISELQVTVE